MSWYENDLVTDADLLAYEGSILSQFNQIDWKDKRRKAIEDWLFLRLSAEGYDPQRLRTRYEPDAVYQYTSAAYTDVSDAAVNDTEDDLNLASIFATPGTDALYVGSKRQFRGLSIRMLDSVSAVSATITVAYWGDGWTNLTLVDGTQRTVGKSFSSGGAVTWKSPTDWVRRTINGSDPYYWVKVTISAVPTSAKATQIGVIRRSVLTGAVAFQTLALIMLEAQTSSGNDGPWAKKQRDYEDRADAALQAAKPSIAGEFDTDESDQVSEAESGQTPASIGGTWRMGRG